MKKTSFILVLIGILILVVGQLFNYGINIKLNEEATFTLNVIPEFLGYLFMTIGFIKLGKYSANFKTATVFGILGVIVSIVIEVLKQNYAQIVSYGIVFELLSAFFMIGALFYFVTGIRSVAQRAGLEKIAANASTYRILFSLFKLISMALNCALIVSGSKVEVVSMWISIPSILFSALAYALLLLIALLTLSSMKDFQRIKA